MELVAARDASAPSLFDGHELCRAIVTGSKLTADTMRAAGTYNKRELIDVVSRVACYACTAEFTQAFLVTA